LEQIPNKFKNFIDHRQFHEKCMVCFKLNIPILKQEILLQNETLENRILKSIISKIKFKNQILNILNKINQYNQRLKRQIITVQINI
jgi:hypothetical protein